MEYEFDVAVVCVRVVWFMCGWCEVGVEGRHGKAPGLCCAGALWDSGRMTESRLLKDAKAMIKKMSTVIIIVPYLIPHCLSSTKVVGKMLIFGSSPWTRQLPGRGDPISTKYIITMSSSSGHLISRGKKKKVSIHTDPLRLEWDQIRQNSLWSDVITVWGFRIDVTRLVTMCKCEVDVIINIFIIRITDHMVIPVNGSWLCSELGALPRLHLVLNKYVSAPLARCTWRKNN